MQLSALIDKLQGLFSRATLVANLVPVVCFFVINAVILGHYDARVAHWIRTYADGDGMQKTLAGLMTAFALLVVAYLFSGFNLILREILEGKYLPSFVSGALTKSEYRRRDNLKNDFDAAARQKSEIEQKRADWEKRLQDARNAPRTTATCTYPELARPVPVRSLLMRSRAATREELEDAVAAFEALLRAHSADLDTPDSRRLDTDHGLLLDAIDEAVRRREDAMLNAHNDREFNFSRYTLAPTRMGNIAESARSYALSRYEMNLDFLWTRFQRVLQGPNGAAYYQTLQDAKTQVDFAISLFWLTVATTLFWMGALPWFGASIKAFATLTFGGIVFARIMYLVGVQNYRSFADLLRSSIDLFRMEVIAGFNLERPLHSKAERRIWRTLSQSLAYGEDELMCFKKE